MPKIRNIIFLIFWCCNLFAQEMTLIPFEVNGKWGLKNPRLETIIQPMYKEVGRASEGLIAVRTLVGFGYTDVRSRMPISAKYDYAYPFEGGYALVYFQGKPYLIDKKGKTLFRHSFIHLKRRGPLVIVTTRDAKKGIVDLNGKLLIDTIYSNIKIYPDSIIVVEKDNRSIVVDRNANPIKILNTIQSREKFVNGLLFSVDYQKSKWVRSIINAQGKECITKDADINKLDYARCIFSDSMLIAISEFNTKKSQFTFNRKGQGLLIFDHSGKLVFQDSIKFSLIHPFQNDIAFIKGYFPDGEGNLNEKWVVINKNGKLVPTDFSIQDVCHSSPDQEIFTKDKVLITTRLRSNTLVVMDNKGKTHATINIDDEFKKQNIEDQAKLDVYKSRIINDDFVFVAFELRRKPKEQYWAIWNLKTKNLSAIQKFDDWDSDDWFNTSKMIFSPFEVSFETNILPNREEKYPIWAKSIEDMPRFSNLSGIQLLLDSTNTQSKYLRFYLVNNSKEPLMLNMQGRTFIGLSLQALDLKGNWKNLDFTAPSWDGGDSYKSMLHAQYYWDCLLPNFQDGLFLTQLRVELKYFLPNDLHVHTLYSETFSGKINLGQLWRNWILDRINHNDWLPDYLEDMY